MKKLARYGEPSREKVISAWAFPSSAGTTIYEIQLHEDGILTCNCPGWVILRMGKDKRECKHVKEVLYEAQQILDGVRPRNISGPVPLNPGITLGKKSKTKTIPTGTGRVIEREIE